MNLNTMELCAFVIEKYFVVNRNVMIFFKAWVFWDSILIQPWSWSFDSGIVWVETALVKILRAQRLRGDAPTDRFNSIEAYIHNSRLH